MRGMISGEGRGDDDFDPSRSWPAEERERISAAALASLLRNQAIRSDPAVVTAQADFSAIKAESDEHLVALRSRRGPVFDKVPGADEEGIEVVHLSGTTVAFRFSGTFSNGEWEIGGCADAAELWADCRRENLWKAAVKDESSMVEEA